MSTPKKTQLHDIHVAEGASMVDFEGWEMPIQYPEGIVAEHLWTRSQCGIFDVSHMGRLTIEGEDALPFLQHVLSSNVAALEPGHAQYCIIPNENGGAIDDAYLYRFEEGKYLLVVNASNREKDLAHIHREAEQYRVAIADDTFRCAAIAVQGPCSEDILKVLSGGLEITEHKRNCLGIVDLEGHRAWISRTGYTGDPIGFEIYVKNDDAQWLWERLQELGAKPIGLGARDTLRLEACLPLYGHEFGTDREGAEIPIFAVSPSCFAVSFAEEKGDFIGKKALSCQHDAFLRIREGNTEDTAALPRHIVPVALTGRGVMREKMDVFYQGKQVGYVTSGTMIPYFRSLEQVAAGVDDPDTAKRAIGLAYIASEIPIGADIEVDIRGRRTKAKVVSLHMKGNAPPYAQPVVQS